MILSEQMKGLLDKEWRYNRGYLFTTLFIIIYAPVIKTIFHLCRGTASMEQWGQELNYALTFGAGVVHPPMVYSGLLQWLPAVGALLLGIIILGEERQNGLNYLVSTPVSRRQIILAKFFPGAATIVLSMIINGLFLISLELIHFMPYNSVDVFNWVLLAGAACLCFFTMALMVSTFTSGVLAAGGVCFFLSFLPRMATAMVDNIAARYFAVAESISIKLYKLSSYLSISDYITRNDRQIITSVQHYPNGIITGICSTWSTSDPGPDYLLESFLLLSGVLISLALAIIIFERSSLQTGGAIFAAGSARKTALVIGALFISYLLVFPRAETLVPFIIFFLLLAGLIYIGMEYLYSCRKQGWQLPKRRK